MNEIKSCPFCGNKPGTIYQYVKRVNGRKIKCCYFLHRCKNNVLVMTGNVTTEEEAIKIWNKRAPLELI